MPNTGIAFDPHWIQSVGDTPESGDGADATTIAPTGGRAASPERDATVEELLIQLVRALDLTALSATDTEATIRDLCFSALAPLPADVAKRHGQQPPHVAAVCVFPFFLPLVRSQLSGTSVRVATVAAGFPDGLAPLSTRVAEVAWCGENGADEVDVVIARPLALEGAWRALYDEVRAFREAAGNTTLKVILSVSDLGDESVVAGAAATCLMAGADYLKTSTGREGEPASLRAGATMLREILRYRGRTGIAVGFKAAGGIRTVDQARTWYHLHLDVLGARAHSMHGFRIGASRLLEDIARALS